MDKPSTTKSFRCFNFPHCALRFPRSSRRAAHMVPFSTSTFFSTHFQFSCPFNEILYDNEEYHPGASIDSSTENIFDEGYSDNERCLVDEDFEDNDTVGEYLENENNYLVDEDFSETHSNRSE